MHHVSQSVSRYPASCVSQPCLPDPASWLPNCSVVALWMLTCGTDTRVNTTLSKKHISKKHVLINAMMTIISRDFRLVRSANTSGQQNS